MQKNWLAEKRIEHLSQCFQPEGREPCLEQPRVDILCANLHYICFIQVLDGGLCATAGSYLMGHGTKTVENHWPKQKVQSPE